MSWRSARLFPFLPAPQFSVTVTFTSTKRLLNNQLLSFDQFSSYLVLHNTTITSNLPVSPIFSRRSALQTAWLVLLSRVTCEPVCSFTFLFNIPLDVFHAPFLLEFPENEEKAFDQGCFLLFWFLWHPQIKVLSEPPQPSACPAAPPRLFPVRMNMFKSLHSWKYAVVCVCSETGNQAKVLHWESWSQIFPRTT